MALASAFRVSELHALSVISDCCRFNVDGSCSLTTCVGFVAKNKTPASAPQRVLISPLREEPRLCPVLALRAYIDRTAQMRGSNRQLFVSAKKPTSKTSPQLISAFIRSTVQRAYEWRATQLTEGQPAPVTSDIPVVSPHTPLASPGVHRTELEGNSPFARAVALQVSSTSVQPSPERNGGCTSDEPLVGAHSRPSCGPFPAPPLSTERDLGASPHPFLLSASLLETGEVVSPRSHSPASRLPSHRQLSGRTAHELRALAASLAYHKGSPLDDILRAVGWSSRNTFARFYLRHLTAVQTRNPYVCLPRPQV